MAAGRQQESGIQTCTLAKQLFQLVRLSAREQALTQPALVFAALLGARTSACKASHCSLPPTVGMNADPGGAARDLLLLLQEGGGAVAREILLRIGQARHLRGSLGSALLEGPDDPVAVGRYLLPVVLLSLEVLLVRRQGCLLISLVQGPLADPVGQVDLLIRELVLERVCRQELLLVVDLGNLLRLHVVLDLVVQVLHDHREQLDDALGLELALALAGEGGLRCLVLRDVEVRALLCQEHALNGPELDGVVRVVRGQRRACTCQELDRILVVLLGL
mmetsp:Transcript_36441/g.113555  ORF Transcript_36441/g.113555 Transcript_36441/m.113555 type:complete len:277 (+) Transcript_36441:18-848(+)